MEKLTLPDNDTKAESTPDHWFDAQTDEDLLSRKETRQIVTPYAFHVSRNLFGARLASPTKRGVAIGIDMVLIGLLTQAASFILAGIAAATFFRAGNRLKQKKRFNSVRIGLRFLAATLLFVFAFGIFDEINFSDGDDVSQSWDIDGIGNDNEISGIEGLVIAGFTTKYAIQAASIEDDVKDGSCENQLSCWQSMGQQLTTDLVELNLSVEQANEMLAVVLKVGDETLSEQDLALINEEFKAGYLQKVAESKDKEIAELASQAQSEVPQVQAEQDIVDNSEPNKPIVDDGSEESFASPGIVAWMKGILEDLGLGFGWAAFYFSIFTAWWKGQTPGKKLMGIKVLKLDESELNLWESFGRYGGYGAGFATGLLGFLQLFWDPNRQAIQDKISETLVIDIRVAKVPFEVAE